MESQTATLYGASRPRPAADRAKVSPRSITSGAVGRFPLLTRASISSSLWASGWSTVILIPYFFSKPSIRPP